MAQCHPAPPSSGSGDVATGLVLDLPDRPGLTRLALPDCVRADAATVAELLAALRGAIGTGPAGGGTLVP